MLKERCQYCGHVFTDAEKAKGEQFVTTVTKPTLVTGAMGGSKITQKPIAFHHTKRCFVGQARQMYTSWVDCEEKEGVWTPIMKNPTGRLPLRKF